MFFFVCVEFHKTGEKKNETFFVCIEVKTYDRGLVKNFEKPMMVGKIFYFIYQIVW